MRCLLRLVLSTLCFSILMVSSALADEADLGRKPDLAYAENLCRAGVAASPSRRARNIGAENKACVDNVRGQIVGSRLGFATLVCESSFRSKPVQRKACYQEAFSQNAPSTMIAGIAYECGQQRDDIMFSACVRLEFMGLDRRLREPSSRRTLRSTTRKGTGSG